MSTVHEQGGTAARALDVAERLVQTRGFNGFSYADIADALGVRKASLHYHFATKADLGEGLIRRYTQRFGEALASIQAECSDAHVKLARYAGLYALVLKDRRMCLCGMLASDYETLSPGMRTALLGFFDLNQAWLERVLDEGRASDGLRYTGSTASQAQLIISTLEGAMLVARSYGDPGRFDTAADNLLAGFGDGPPAVPPPGPRARIARGRQPRSAGHLEGER